MDNDEIGDMEDDMVEAMKDYDPDENENEDDEFSRGDYKIALQMVSDMDVDEDIENMSEELSEQP